MFRASVRATRPALRAAMYVCFTSSLIHHAPVTAAAPPAAASMIFRLERGGMDFARFIVEDAVEYLICDGVCCVIFCRRQTLQVQGPEAPSRGERKEREDIIDALWSHYLDDGHNTACR